MRRTARLGLWILILLPVLLVVTFFACSPRLPAPPGDEQLLRGIWQLPPQATLTNLTANPKIGGTFGREGLRIVATFQLPPAGLAPYVATVRAGSWQPLPLPANLTSLPRGTAELSNAAPDGRYLCLVSNGATTAAGPWSVFAAPGAPSAPGGYLSHTIAVTDPATETVTIVYQQQY